MNARICLLVLLPALAAAQSPPQLEWKSFSPSDGSFTVLFPGTPAEFKESIKTAQGKVEVLVFEMKVPGTPGKFVVSYSEFPESSLKPGTEDKRLDNARDGAVASSKGTLKREKSLLLDNYPGRELTIEVDGKAAVVMRMYAVKNRLYQVVAVGPADLILSQDALKFLTSFKLNAK